MTKIGYPQKEEERRDMNCIITREKVEYTDKETKEQKTFDAWYVTINGHKLAILPSKYTRSALEILVNYNK